MFANSVQVAVKDVNHCIICSAIDAIVVLD